MYRQRKDELKACRRQHDQERKLHQITRRQYQDLAKSLHQFVPEHPEEDDSTFNPLLQSPATRSQHSHSQ
jgi:hypothetical protein